MDSKGTELLQALSGAIEGVAAAASPSVVSVGTDHRTGTGILFDSSGHVLTAGHVVGRLTEVLVGTVEGTQKAKVVGLNPYSDLALLKVEPGGGKPIELGDSAEVRVGQFVLALANPQGRSPSVTSGVVTGVNRQVGGWWHFSVGNAIVTDARLNPGYSGGPLLDAGGRMIGMNIAYMSNRGIAVPLASIRKEFDRLARGESAKRAYLGVVSSPVSLPEEVASKPDVSQRTGLMIFSVEPGSAARGAGLVLGDVLVRFGDKPVGSLFDLEALLGEDAIGRETQIVVLRGEELKELRVTPSAAE